ncbi:MAG: class I SAM-dependent methyltransferase, partial [Proteobacteria bacterium]|nr:class I SAM-dependent methyltransferase [Pseudomonadota bacterium]
MSLVSPAFAFPIPAQPLVLGAARALAARLGAGEIISRPDLAAILGEHFGGSDVAGRWSVHDAHAALELGQVLTLQQNPALTCTLAPELADEAFSRFEALVPSQNNRSDEQIELQQFATPPRLAWIAARACAIASGEQVLEPSAGTGMLAVWADKAKARLALNEISPLRRECLGAVFPAASVTAHDGELIDELLGADVAPSVVLMNPPYSHGLERGHDGRTGARHLRSAWKRLLPGGRLVAVMPEWFDLPRFLNGISGPVSLRLNAAIERA